MEDQHSGQVLQRGTGGTDVPVPRLLVHHARTRHFPRNLEGLDRALLCGPNRPSTGTGSPASALRDNANWEPGDIRSDVALPQGGRGFEGGGQCPQV